LLSRKELIENWPNCKFKCTQPWWHWEIYQCCSAAACAKHKGYYDEGEVEQFSREQQKLIKSLWNDESGYWRENGCAVPVPLRSYRCLQFVCSEDEHTAY